MDFGTWAKRHKMKRLRISWDVLVNVKSGWQEELCVLLFYLCNTLTHEREGKTSGYIDRSKESDEDL